MSVLQVLNRAAENWYTYRSLVTQRLEVVAQTLHERNYDALIDNHEVSLGTSWHSAFGVLEATVPLTIALPFL